MPNFFGGSDMPIYFTEWQGYPWKNEIATQLERVEIHFHEIISDDFSGEHSPFDMLDRAIVLCAFSIRRMIEKKLVTDRLASFTISVNNFSAKDGSSFRRPYHSRSGGHVHESYDFGDIKVMKMTAEDLANEIIHSAQIMISHNEPGLRDGILLASDRHSDKRVLNLTIEEFREFAQMILDDNVVSSSDGWDPETGKVSAERK